MVAKVVMKAVRMWNRRFCYSMLLGHDVSVLLGITYHGNTEGHDVKGQGGDQHDHKDNPADVSLEPSSVDSMSLPESVGAIGTSFLVCNVFWQHGRKAGGHRGMLLHDFHGIHHDCNGMMVGWEYVMLGTMYRVS